MLKNRGGKRFLLSTVTKRFGYGFSTVNKVLNSTCFGIVLNNKRFIIRQHLFDRIYRAKWKIYWGKWKNNNVIKYHCQGSTNYTVYYVHYILYLNERACLVFEFIEKFIKSCKRLVVYYLVLFYRTEIALI